MLKPRRHRKTGPDADVWEAVRARFWGLCARCGESGPGNVHHRQPRGMGGTSRPGTNSPANLLWLCGSGTTGCHGYVESYRTEAAEQGWLVKHPRDPADVPVLLWDGQRVLLDAEGGYRSVPEVEA